MTSADPESSPRAPSAALAQTLFVALCLVWGSTWLVIRFGLEDIPPFTGAAARFLSAWACMALLAHLWAKKEGGGRPPRIVVWAHGLFQFAFNYALVYVGETLIPSGLVAVLWAVYPLFIALGGHFVTRESPLEARQWLGILVSFAGVALLFATDLWEIDLRAVGMGLLVLLAPLSVTVSTFLVTKRALGASSLLLNRDAMLIGVGVLVPAAFVLERPLEAHWTWQAVASVAYLSLFGTVFAFGVYMWLLRYVPAYQLSLMSFITPVVALLLGAAFGGEPLRLHTWMGTALVLGGVGVTRGIKPSPRR